MLGSNRIANHGAAALAQCLPSLRRLRTLQLFGNEIGDQGAASLAAAVGVGGVLPLLSSLDLSGNRRIGAEGIDALANALIDIDHSSRATSGGRRGSLRKAILPSCVRISLDSSPASAEARARLEALLASRRQRIEG